VVHYFDTSALTKLVIEEHESPALRTWLETSDRQPVSSDLARTELVRAVRRSQPERVLRARAILERIDVLELTSTVFDHAGRVDPVELRSLDALHLAAAIALGDHLEAIVTYDERLASAARANGIAVIAPS
jgi:predicted nucleic acid-binding protein